MREAGVRMETYMTVKEVAAAVQLSAQTIYRYVMRREIPFLKIGRAVRFQQGEIKKWAETIKTGSSAGRNENREGAKRVQSEWVDTPVEKVTTMKSVDDGLVREDGVQLWIDILRTYGELTADVAAGDVYTNEFNPNSPDYKFKK